jgi:signal transduction histidine kinase
MDQINILMVDDQPAKLLTYESMLSQMGERLIKAQTASEALSHLLKDDIAVVLMDVNMPELDGFELAAMIRQHPRCRRTAIIFVSAVHLSDVDRVKGYETGAVDYVSVPVVPEILRAKIGVFADLYRKTSELEHVNQSLEERVSERTQELQSTIAQLRERENRLRLQGEALAEADRRKTEFLAMLAHELRNPLQPIRASVELLRQTKATLEQLQWARDVVDRQVNQLVRLVDDLLDASRISSGKLELRKDIVDFISIVSGAVESSRPLAERKNQRITLNLPSEPIYIDGDGVRLMQVVLNLLNNSVKYSPMGARISLAVEGREGNVVTRIRDEGMGIASADLSRIFEMFYQGQAKADDAQGGLGLGLALVPPARRPARRERGSAQ